MRKFSRETNQRRAFLKGLAANLILKEKIKTTETRAKELRTIVDRVISRAKKSGLAGQKSAFSFLPMAAAKKLKNEIVPRFSDGGGQPRTSGFTRITRIGPRGSDGAKMVYIELIK